MKAIILAGGSGTRLWPVSTKKLPKQFAKMFGMEESLFLKTFRRCLGLMDARDVYVSANEGFRNLILSDIGKLGVDYDPDNLIMEPCAKNTLPAIYAAVREIRKKGEDTVVVFPADHMIVREREFENIIRESSLLAHESLVTFGIKPDRPETGYGYISPGAVAGKGFRIREFREKPDRHTAAEYIDRGYLWNAGIFMFRTDVFADEVRKHAPAIYNAFSKGADIAEAFSMIETGISIDRGLMEKSGIVTVVPADIGWNDLGSFDSFYDALDMDNSGNLPSEGDILIDSRNTITSHGKDKRIVAIGMEDVIIIDTDDVLLVCKKGESQKVRDAVLLMEDMNHAE